MTLQRWNGATLLCALIALSAVSGCERKGAQQAPGEIGGVKLALRTDDGQTIASVGYSVDDAAGNELIASTINVSRPYATVSAEISLRAGEDYVLALTASTAQGNDCGGTSAPFDVVAGETTEVMIELACEGVGPTESENNGHVVVTATVSTPEATVCPDIESATVSPLVTAVNDTIDLSATGSEAGMTFAWSASSGTLASAGSAATSFRCTAAGDVTITLTATSGECSDTETFEVTCLDNVCRDLGRICHNVDDGDGPLHHCHEVGHSNDPAACAAAEPACVAGCGAALCTALSELCHDVADQSAFLENCHEVAHAGEAAACYEIGRECWDACTAAQSAGAGGTSGGGAGGAGGGSGAAGTSGTGGAGGGPSEPVEVTIQFEPEVGTAEFDCTQSYAGIGSAGTTVTPRDFRFFVQDLRLVTSGGVEVPVALDTRAPWQNANLALIDFIDDAAGCGGSVGATSGTNTVVTGTVPPGDYVGVVFRNGVPEALNHADPTTLAAPLSFTQLSWGWLSGYRFLMAEVSTADALGVGLAHPGSTACSGSPAAGTVSCARANRNEVRLSGFDAASNVIVADLAAIFAQTNVSEDNQCHGGPAAVCTPMYTALGIDFATGASLATQSVYRVE